VAAVAAIGRNHSASSRNLHHGPHGHHSRSEAGSLWNEIFDEEEAFFK